MSTAFFTDLRTHAHTHSGHPEHAARLTAVLQRLTEADVLSRMQARTPSPASDDELLRVHTPEHLALVAGPEASGQPALISGDTYILPESNLAARLSAGAALGAVDAVMTGEVDNALVAMRPPGHHALPDRAMGFCLFANAALAARHAQARHGVERVMIVDFDVHHGNGTQDIFYDDPGVLFVSTHQSPLYPGSGQVEEVGAQGGEGYTINVPLRPGHGDSTLAAVYEQVVWPAAARYDPDLVLISAGFDAHWNDPLGGLTMTLSGFAHLSRELVRMAADYADGRIVFLLEGGYSLPVVAHGVLNAAYALLDDSTVSDPLPLPETLKRRQETVGVPRRLLAHLRDVHML